MSSTSKSAPGYGCVSVWNWTSVKFASTSALVTVMPHPVACVNAVNGIVTYAVYVVPVYVYLKSLLAVFVAADAHFNFTSYWYVPFPHFMYIVIPVYIVTSVVANVGLPLS
jgi:hypothetical protein